MSYIMGRGDIPALDFEPYKTTLLPLFRYRNPEVAMRSSVALWQRFLDYDERKDFVGMDMARKFIRMGMIRAKTDVNGTGGKEYDDEANILPASEGHERKEEEMEKASGIFRKHLDRIERHQGYKTKKEAFRKEKKHWKQNRLRERKAVRTLNFVDSDVDTDD